MLIKQISAGDALSQQVVNEIIKRSTVMENAEFYSMTGNADYQRKSSAATGGKVRALNADWAENKVTPVFDNPSLKIIGDKVQTDKAHERRGNDIASVRASDLLKFAQDLGKTFQNYFFNGTGLNNQPTGLVAKMPAAQVITASANGLLVELGNTAAQKTAQQKYIELLDQLIESVDGGAQVIYMDGKLWSRTNSIAREYINYEKNEFGIMIPYYAGIPIRPAGYDVSGNRIIPHTETVGESADCTSVYAVRFGERSDLTIASNVGIEVKDEGLVGNFYTYSVELDCELSLLNNKSVAKIEGIRLGS